MCNPGTTTTLALAAGHTAEPIDAVLDRLNDPAVAAAMVTLLDNIDLLSTLVVGLAGFMDRGDTIMDSASESAGVEKGMDLLVEIARAIGQPM